MAEQSEALQTGRALRARLWPVMVAAGVGVLAYSFPLSPPRTGAAIGSWSYSVNTDELRESKERWGLRSDSGDAIHTAADQLAAKFVLSTKDEALLAFLNESAATTSTSVGLITAYIEHYCFWSLQRYLGWSRPDASAVTRKKLFVASEQQMQALLLAEKQHRQEETPTLLDIGSGRGTETEKLAAALGIGHQDVTCLESSSGLRSALAARGFKVATSLEELRQQTFHAAALFNVLDRCDEPLSLLHTAIELLQPNGLLLIATTLPFQALVHEGRFGSKWERAAHRPPVSPLTLHPAARVRGKTSPSFEISAAAFIATLFPRGSGIELLAWTRLPYLSSGDTWRTHYVKSMAVFVLRVPATARMRSPEARSAENEAEAVIEEDEDQDEEEEGGLDSDERSDVPPVCSQKPPDAIYTWLSDTMTSEGVESWGSILDAGTGLGSACWLMRQSYRHITAVTATTSGTYGADKLQTAAEAPGTRLEIALGNWRETNFLRGRSFDVVVADYLLGATEYHWRFGAETMMDRLYTAVAPGGYLLIVGIEPYAEVLDGPGHWQDQVVLDVEGLGDAASALAGRSTYRELPEQWVLDHVRRRGGFVVVATKQFAMRLSATSLRRQLEFAKKTAKGVADTALQRALVRRAEELEVKLKRFGTHHRARNYAIVVQRRDQ